MNISEIIRKINAAERRGEKTVSFQIAETRGVIGENETTPAALDLMGRLMKRGYQVEIHDKNLKVNL